jgi:hypothetical protein
MARMLGNLEFVQFMQDNGDTVRSMSYPQTKLIEWNGIEVLVFIGPNPIDIGDGNLYQDVYLADVSDAPQLAAMGSGAYQQPTQSMLDALPQAITDTIASDAATAGQLVNSAGQSAKNVLLQAASTVGQTAGNLLAPVASSLSPILVGAIVVLALVMLPKGR